MSPLHRRGASEDYEMADNGGESSHPLLNGSPNLGTRHETRSSRYIRPTSAQVLKRWWKPLAALLSPFILLFIYAMVHPHVPGLPPLPTVSIHHGGSTSGEWVGEVNIPQDVCNCGATDEGERLCSIYQPEGLRHSRAIEGSGARVRRVLQKAREGHALKIGVLGGSGEFTGALTPLAWLLHHDTTNRPV
jgi:hypothetical protein